MTTGIGAGRYVGQRVPRKEDPRLLTGKGTFVDDVVMPGMLHVAFVRSPIASGKILSIGTAAALSVPGVHAIYTAADLARHPVIMHSFFLGPVEVAVTPLATTHVAYVGHPVALVIADDRYVAEDAASLAEVTYDEQPAIVTIADAMSGPPVHPDTDDNIAVAMGDDEPDELLEAQLAGAAHLVSATTKHQRISQSPMETRGIVVSQQGAEELLVHVTCAGPHLVARYITLALGLPDMNVRVIAKDVGGSFGLKNHPWLEEMAVIQAALVFGRPLKWIEDRWENLTASNQAREQEMHLRVGFDLQGKLLAAHSTYDLNNGAYPMGADANIAVHMFLWAAYNMPAYSFQSRGWYSNTQGLAAYRGPWAMETLARETLLDKAARQIGIDPIEIRRRNLCHAADQPSMTSLGIPREDITPVECLDKLLDHVDVAAFRKEQAEARKQGRHLGIGFAAYIEPTGAAGAIPVMTGELAQIRVEPTGKVVAVMSTHSQGHGTSTTMAQIIAEQLGVRYEDVTVHEGDSARGGFGPGAGGSRQGVIGGGAAMKAGALLADKIRTVAAHLLNASPASIRIENGIVHVDGEPDQTRSLRQIAEIAYGEPMRLPPGLETGLEAQCRYDPPPMTFTSAAHACIVEVDPDTGFVKILRWVSSEDCGTIIHPAMVEGQIAGGLAQAIGSVLLEEAGYDARGNPIAATFKDYLLPAISDIPQFEYLHASTPSKAEGGFRGVGEGGAIIGPPTLVNAIADALAPFGEIAVDLPLTPTKILSVIEGRDLSARHAPAPPPAPPREVAASTAPAQLAPSSEAAATVAGDWDVILATPLGPQSIRAHFETDGNTLSGYLSSSDGMQDFTGTVDGGNIVFDLKVTKPMKITLKYALTVSGDSISGTCKMGIFGKAKLSGHRAG